MNVHSHDIEVQAQVKQIIDYSEWPTSAGVPEAGRLSLAPVTNRGGEPLYLLLVKKSIKNAIIVCLGDDQLDRPAAAPQH
jgi:hypothetical protein